MKERCANPRHKDFGNYGGRGIVVCERWRDSFDDFCTDVGEKPTPKHSLDRYPNVNGNYEPSNVRWATAKEQAGNKRPLPVKKFVTYQGETDSIRGWATRLNVKYKRLWQWLDQGKSFERFVERIRTVA
jgi:hypothetical protein